MVTINNDKLISKEIEMRLRNADIYSIGERGVTTVTEEIILSSSTEYLIKRENVKNIRNITDLTFGVDYTYDLDYDDSGSINCKITFTSPKTGTFELTYDYGDRDKIFYGLTRQENTLEDYPLIKIEVTSVRSDQASLDGKIFEEDYLITIYTYELGVDTLNDTIANLKTFILENQKEFYYLRYIIPVARSPVLYSPDRNDKIVFRTLELRSPLNEETI